MKEPHHNTLAYEKYLALRRLITIVSKLQSLQSYCRQNNVPMPDFETAIQQWWGFISDVEAKKRGN